MRVAAVATSPRELFGPVASASTCWRGLAEIDDRRRAGIETARARIRRRVWDLIAPTPKLHVAPREPRATVPVSGGAFCRVAARRLDPAESGLRVTGPQGTAALCVLRTYAA